MTIGEQLRAARALGYELGMRDAADLLRGAMSKMSTKNAIALAHLRGALGEMQSREQAARNGEMG